MSFAVGADEYDRFMGRYSRPLAPRFAGFAGIAAGQRALDVGCGPGALTSELVERLGAHAVWAVDPSERFVAAARARQPGVSVQLAAAETLPFGDRRFDAVLAQLVVHFMTDAVAGLREMARVTGRNGIVAACVWDHAGGRGPLNVFWDAARELDADVADESRLAGAREGHLVELFDAAGVHAIEETSLSVDVEHESFEEWWEPFTLGVGPAGACCSPGGASRERSRRGSSKRSVGTASGGCRWDRSAWAPSIGCSATGSAGPSRARHCSASTRGRAETRSSRWSWPAFSKRTSTSIRRSRFPRRSKSSCARGSAGSRRPRAPSGVTTTVFAVGRFADIDATTKTDVNSGARTDFWKSRIDTKGASDLYVLQNTIAPGGTFGWHSHPGPSLVIVKSGTATFYMGDDPTCTPHVVPAGSGFVDNGHDVHVVRNEGSVDLVTVVTSLVPAGFARRIDEPSPGACPS